MDDPFFSEQSKISIQSTVCLSIAFTFFALNVVLLGIFSFSNPDSEDSWYSKETEMVYSEEALAPEGVNMHRRFAIWLKWGFWNHIVLALVIIGTCFCQPARQQRLFLNTLLCSVCLLTCSMQFWGILGAVWRFNRAGRISCGDYLERPDIDESFDYSEWNAEAKAEGY